MKNKSEMYFLNIYSLALQVSHSFQSLIIIYQSLNVTDNNVKLLIITQNICANYEAKIASAKFKHLEF